MKMIFTLLIIVFTKLSFASLSCFGTDSVNLADKNGSLHPLRITNQNGLGICHIEQLHKLLKAKMPGHPDLSRVQLAIMEKKQRDASGPVHKKAVRWKNEKGIGGTYIDAGNTCDAFNLIKGQRICRAESDRFEQLTKKNPYDQEKIIETLSEYFDTRTQLPLFTGYPFTNSLTEVEVKIDSAMKACPVNKELFQSLKASYISHLKNQSKWYGVFYNKALYDAEKLTPLSIQMSAKDFKDGKSYLIHLQKIFPRNYSNLYKGSGDLLSKNISMVASEMKKNESCLLAKIKEDNDSPFCPNPLSPSAKDVLNLTNLGMTLREIANILDGHKDRDHFFSEAFACNSTKIQIPTNLSCSKIDLTELSKNSNSKDHFESQAASTIESKIKKGTPVGISTCTRYFKDPTAQTLVSGTNKFTCGDTKATGYKKGEGSHAVTIIGSRCKNGVKEYLIQNSWGSSCSSYHTSYECSGQGGFWTPASVVINNTRMLNILE